MTQDEFQSGIVLISGYFGSAWPNESVGQAYQQLKDCDARSLFNAHKRIVIEFQPRPLPAIGKIIQVVKEEAGKINMSSSPNEPLSRRQNDAEYSKFGQKSSEYHKRASAFCMKLCNGEMTLDQIINTCRMLDVTYPGVGWRDTMVFFLGQNREDLDQ